MLSAVVGLSSPDPRESRVVFGGGEARAETAWWVYCRHATKPRALHNVRSPTQSRFIRYVRA